MKLKFIVLFNSIMILCLALNQNAFSQDKSIDRLVGNWLCFQIMTEKCDDPKLNRTVNCPDNTRYIFYPDGGTLLFWDAEKPEKGTFEVKGNSIVLNGKKSENLTFYIEKDTFSIVDPDKGSCYETQRFKRVK